MWRLRLLAVTGALAGMLIFAGVASAGWYWNGGWYWNASVQVEGVPVSTAWTVVDANGESLDHEAHDFRTAIRISKPKAANGEVLEEAKDESATLKSSPKLHCTPDGIEAEVTYHVAAKGKTLGKTVELTVTVGTEDTYTASGKLGENITVSGILIPATCSGE